MLRQAPGVLSFTVQHNNQPFLFAGCTCLASSSHRDGSGEEGAAGPGPSPPHGPHPATPWAGASAAAATQPTLKQQAQSSNQEVYDRLIEVFQQKTPEEWRKLIAFSKQWPSLVQGVLDRWDSGGEGGGGEAALRAM